MRVTGTLHSLARAVFCEDTNFSYFHCSRIRIFLLFSYSDTMVSKLVLEIVTSMGDDDDDFFARASLGAGKPKKKAKYTYERMGWEDGHLAMLRHLGEDEFQRRYHMTEASFNKLVELLRDDLAIDKKQSANSTGGNAPIIPELVVASGLRFLGGESYAALADIFGISLSSARRIVNKFLNAVQDCPELALKLPTTTEELKQHADDWEKLSGAFGLFYGAIGAIDGWLACIQAPSKNDPSFDGRPNQTCFFSGHYQRYGLNIQAVCDANLRFIYFGVIAPGKTNDLRAFGRCEKLQEWLKDLPPEYFLVGDNAYTLSNNLLVPFSGSQKKEKYKQEYNFYLSQLRIRIEMAFGRLTTKWRIFRKNLDCTLQKNSLICSVAARLHNFVIDNDRISFPDGNDNELTEFGIDALLDGPDGNNGFLPSTVEDENEVDNAERRNHILAGIEEKQLVRPAHNILRNDVGE